MNFDFSSLNFETIDSNINAYLDMYINQNGVTFTKKCLRIWVIPPMCCAYWMPRRRCSRSVCARAVSRRALSSPSRGVEQKGVVTISTKICWNRSAPPRARIGFRASGTAFAASGRDAKTMCFDLNEGVQEDFRPNPTNNDAK